MGWAAGFQAGSQLAQRGLDAYDKARKERLMSEAEKQTPTITEGAYGPGLEENIQQVMGLRDQALKATGGDEAAIARVDAQYNPALQELQRRAGLTQADYSLGSAGPNYETLQRATGQQGLVTAMNQAKVYRQLGEPEKAAQLEADARRSLAEIETSEYQAKARPLALRAAELGIDKQTQDLATGALTLAEKQRAAKEAENLQSFQGAVAALPPEQQNNSRTLMDLATKFNLTTQQQDKLIADRANRSTNEITLARNEITKLVKGKSLDQLSDLHKTNDMLDPGRHFEVLRNSKGGVILQMVDSATGDPIGPPAFKGSEAEATKYLYTAATAPETLVEYAASLEKARLDAKKTQAQITKDEALGLAATRNAASNAANAATTEAYRRSQGIKPFTNAAGEVVMVDVAKLPVNADGTISMPKGLRPARENVEPSEAVVNKIAEGLIGTPIPGAGLKDGEPIVYDAATAYTEAYRQAFVARNPGAQRNAPKSPADLLAEEIAARAREDALRKAGGSRGGPGIQTNPASRTPSRLGMMPFDPGPQE